jgi:hypothetical protein
MKATIRIKNETDYRTEHLRAFVVKARDQVFGSERKPLRVRFIPSRKRTHGRASLGGSRSLIWLPLNADRYELAQILIHELAHNAGASGELWMRRSMKYGWGLGWKNNVAWAADLPLELKPEKPAPAASDRFAERLASIAVRRRAWATKAKRAATALKKLARQERYYTRKLAASISPKGTDS